MSQALRESVEFLQKKIGDFKPEVGIVLGTGLGGLVNEIEVLHSRNLLTEVIKELHLTAPTFEKKKFGYSSAYSTSPISIEVQSIIYQNVNKIDNKISFIYLDNKKQVKINNNIYNIIPSYLPITKKNPTRFKII